MRFRSLRNRIVFFFTLLLVLVQAIAFILVNSISLRIATQQNEQELAIGERVFQRLLAQNRQQLTDTARLLSADFAFREAIATSDQATILSVLNNHGSRIAADVMMLIAIDGRLIADTLQRQHVNQSQWVSTLLQTAEAQGHATAVKMISDQAYQVAMVPVLAPTPIAWVIVGFVIDDSAARDLHNLTSLHVSFLSKPRDSEWRLFASTQPTELKQTLENALNETVTATPVTLLPTAVQGYQSLVTILDEHDQVPVMAVLQHSLATTFERLQNLRTTLLILGVASLVLSLIGGYVIARSVTRPLRILTKVAHRIQAGDYQQTTVNERTDEIGELAAAFDHMCAGVADREKEILRLAFEDTLTKLPNRAMFNHRLDQMVKLAKREDKHFSVLMMDLNRFKYINDTLGHEAGDEVLQAVGERLKICLLESDTIARLGGDEFAILLATTDADSLTTIINKMQAVLEEPIMIDNQPVDIGFSIGIARYPQHGMETSTLMRCADVAMYTAKRTKSVYTVYDSRHDLSRQEHLSLLGQLRKATENNELQLFYQPKVNLLRGGITSVETLVRWQHPERGLIPPSEFIPFAEQTGAIRIITRWVIAAALRQSGVWLQQSTPIQMSINISARDLLDRDLPDFVAAELQKNQVPAPMICLEITESALMEDPEGAHKTVTHLHNMGLELSIDDYGTGYSSLAYVKMLPVNELKIDRAFIMNMTTQSKDKAIVRSTIELGHNLDLSVVAEGIENEEELALLRSFGCDHAQGYLISRPLNANALRKWLLESRWTNLKTDDSATDASSLTLV